jgi:GST-like protein
LLSPIENSVLINKRVNNTEQETSMTKQAEYTLPKVWKWESENGGEWAKINRPIAGATHDKELPVGEHPFQLYSMGTPNGVKVTVMFEELLALDIKEAEYDAFLINIMEGDQFGSGFVDLNPNSKIPALLDNSDPENSVKIFESGAILLHLAEKFDVFLPQDSTRRTECLSWLFWQMGSAPYLGGGFGHFYAYAPFPIEYCIDRFTMETKRQLDVLDKQLEKNQFICGDEYTIADIAIWSWYGPVVLNTLYGAAEFLDVDSYKHLTRWTNEIFNRPAVQRGRKVNRTWGDPEDQLHERHAAGDFDTNTQDKLNP